MNGIKQAALSVSLSFLLLGAVYMLCPTGKGEKVMKYVIALLTVACIITPFAKVSFDIELPKSSNVEINAKAMLISQAKYSVGELLQKNGIAYEKIEIDTDISEDGNIFISSVCVEGASDVRKAQNLIAENTGAKRIIFDD